MATATATTINLNVRKGPETGDKAVFTLDCNYGGERSSFDLSGLETRVLGEFLMTLLMLASMPEVVKLDVPKVLQ